MYGPLTLAFKYLRYLFMAANGKGHGVHSPFVFEFITRVLNDKRHFYAFDAIEKIDRNYCPITTPLPFKILVRGRGLQKPILEKSVTLQKVL
jgi:hypothetical protein